MSRPAATSDPHARAIGAALRQWMFEQELTQQEMARRAGVSQPMVSRAIRGRLATDSPGMHKLCRIAGVDLAGESSKGAEREPGHRLPSRLLRSIEDLWTGTTTDAVQLSQLLEALAEWRYGKPAR